MKIERIDLEGRQVILGKTFMATLDGGKHHFPKHVSLYTQVKNDELMARLEKVGVGTEIQAQIGEDERECRNYLIEFSVVEKSPVQ